MAIKSGHKKWPRKIHMRSMDCSDQPTAGGNPIHAAVCFMLHSAQPCILFKAEVFSKLKFFQRCSLFNAAVFAIIETSVFSDLGLGLEINDVFNMALCL